MTMTDLSSEPDYEMVNSICLESLESLSGRSETAPSRTSVFDGMELSFPDPNATISLDGDIESVCHSEESTNTEPLSPVPPLEDPDETPKASMQVTGDSKEERIKNWLNQSMRCSKNQLPSTPENLHADSPKSILPAYLRLFSLLCLILTISSAYLTWSSTRQRVISTTNIRVSSVKQRSRPCGMTSLSIVRCGCLNASWKPSDLNLAQANSGQRMKKVVAPHVIQPSGPAVKRAFEVLSTIKTTAQSAAGTPAKHEGRNNVVAPVSDREGDLREGSTLEHHEASDYDWHKMLQNTLENHHLKWEKFKVDHLKKFEHLYIGDSNLLKWKMFKPEHAKWLEALYIECPQLADLITNSETLSKLFADQNPYSGLLKPPKEALTNLLSKSVETRRRLSSLMSHDFNASSVFSQFAKQLDVLKPKRKRLLWKAVKGYSRLKHAGMREYREWGPSPIIQSHLQRSKNLYNQYKPLYKETMKQARHGYSLNMQKFKKKRCLKEGFKGMDVVVLV